MLTLEPDLARASMANSCIHDLVAMQAAATPAAAAVTGRGRHLSYRELNESANQLAHHLQKLGVGPETVVAVCLDRSVELVVALLAVLKAGGAYLPLDPAYPADRLRFMLEDAKAPILIDSQFLESASSESRANPDSAVTADNLAYVIYTSGSTGTPKGVQITHRNLLSLIDWHLGAFEITSADRATQVTSPAFDATGWEIWPYLAAGASVHIAPDDVRTDPEAMRDWLLEERVTVSFLPTPLAERAIALEWPRLGALRLLLTGADTLHVYPDARLPFALVNNYGPTETTVVATSGVVPTADSDRDHPPSIGRPVANTQIHILDGELVPVAAGEVGEIFIGGDGVGRGYLNRPELTSQRFLADPFAGRPGARMYRTGDLARYLANGEIAFLGRADHQVKIRGFRVEPDEVATVLSRHPDVRSAAVIGREDAPGEMRLVGYITAAAGASLTLSSVVDALAAHLPDHMIPSAFVVMDELPLTPNGKVDRAALPPPDSDNMLRDEPAVEALTHTEARLAGIVAPLLRLDRISIDDNFFLLGGSSLMGAQLIARVKEVFGVALPLRTLFENPTVRRLAVEVELAVVAAVESMSESEVLQLLEKGA